MLLDFEVQRCTRRCAQTDRPLAVGETCYSVLEASASEVVRKDFCADVWRGPPDSAIAWWRSRVPEQTARKVKLAPNDVLLELFDQLADQHEQQDLRYVLTLLLIRRRVVRIDMPDDGAADVICVYCPKRDATYSVAVAMPDQARIDQIQQQLSDLLIADAE